MQIPRELVEACRRGDPGAFERLVRRTHRPLYTLIYRLMGNHDDAADVTQETYVRVWRNLRGFRGEADLATWLHRVATNMALTHLKRRARSPRAVAPEELQALERGLDDTEARLDAQAVEQALARLPASHRAAVVMKDVYGWTCEEIAKAMGMTEGAVKVRLFRARRRLADELTGAGGFEGPGRRSGGQPTRRVVVPMRKRKAAQ